MLVKLSRSPRMRASFSRQMCDGAQGAELEQPPALPYETTLPMMQELLAISTSPPRTSPTTRPPDISISPNDFTAKPRLGSPFGGEPSGELMSRSVIEVALPVPMSPP